MKTNVKRFFIAILSVSLAYGCISSGSVRLTADDDGNVEVVGEITFETQDGKESEAANSVFQTREVDPTLYANEPNYPHSGTLTLTLDDGTTVSHSQDLYYDSSTVVTPASSGYEALAYRPANPSALQSFLDQYWSQASSAKLITDVGLRDISSESTSTSVDVQTSAHDQLEYIGTGSVTTTGSEPLQKDF